MFIPCLWQGGLEHERSLTKQDKKQKHEPKFQHMHISKNKVGHLDKQKNKTTNMTAVYFNSRTFKGGHHHLSTLFGGVEFDYMSARFPQKALKGLFAQLRVCDSATFLEWLQILQPGKKWTPQKLSYWFTPDRDPVHGILAQMLGSMVRHSRTTGKITATSRHRQAAVCKKLGLAKIEVAPELSDDGKKALMKECLRKKYAGEPYRSFLLSTGSAELHEKPARGKGNRWTSPGGDWLGKLLTEVRSEILSKERPEKTGEAPSQE